MIGLNNTQKQPTTYMGGQAKNISHNVSGYAMFAGGILWRDSALPTANMGELWRLPWEIKMEPKRTA